jgi:hypothetical protein
MMERQVVASAQEISPAMPEFSIQHSGGEPQGTAGAKATQSHPEAKAECNVQNAERRGKAT